MKTFIQASRPKTLIATLSPITIGTVVAYSLGSFSFKIFFFTLLTGLGIQIGTNYANDLYDFLKGADTPSRKGPARVTASGLIQVTQMKLATLCILLFTALCGSVLIFHGGWMIALLVVLALLLALGYTAGPFPLAYLGVAELFIFIFFGPIASGMTAYLQTLYFTPQAFLAGIGPGLISCSLLVINNLRDEAEDRQANKKTLVVRFGQSFGKKEYCLCLIGAFIPPALLASTHPRALLALSCLFPAYLLIKEVIHNHDPYAYNPMLGKTGQLLALYTAIFSIGYIL